MHSHHDHSEGEASASSPPPAGLEAARALIEQEEARRMQACAEEIQAVLERYGMVLEVTPAQIVLSPKSQ